MKRIYGLVGCTLLIVSLGGLALATSMQPRVHIVSVNAPQKEGLGTLTLLNLSPESARVYLDAAGCNSPSIRTILEVPAYQSIRTDVYFSESHDGARRLSTHVSWSYGRRLFSKAVEKDLK